MMYNYEADKEVNIENKYNSYYSSFKTEKSMIDHESNYEEIVKLIEVDSDFVIFYNIIREQYSLFQEFSHLDTNKKLEILIRSFFFVIF
jgi:hypothetical protein